MKYEEVYPHAHDNPKEARANTAYTNVEDGDARSRFVIDITSLECQIGQRHPKLR